MNRRGLVLLFLAAVPLAGQDEFRVSSPNGNLEFRLGIAQPEPGSLSRLAGASRALRSSNRPRESLSRRAFASPAPRMPFPARGEPLA